MGWPPNPYKKGGPAAIPGSVVMKDGEWLDGYPEVSRTEQDSSNEIKELLQQQLPNQRIKLVNLLKNKK